MKKESTFTKFIFFFIIILCLHSIFGQSSAQYLLNEQLFLQTDREVYIAGENLFFKLDLIEAPDSVRWPVSKIAYIVFRNTDNVRIAGISIEINNRKAWGHIYLPDTLKTGTYQLAAFTNTMRNQGEDAYFRKEIFIANRFDGRFNTLEKVKCSQPTSLNEVVANDYSIIENERPELRISTEEARYGNRKKIKAYIEFTSSDGDSLVSLSVSVAEELSRHSVDSSDIDMISGGRVRGMQPGLKSNLDYHGDKLIYVPESSGMIFRGRVIRLTNNKPVRGVYVLLSTPDSLVNLNYAITDSNGVFNFLINDYYEGKKLIFCLRGHNRNLADCRIILDDRFSLAKDFEPAPAAGISDDLREYLIRSQDIVRVQKSYDVSNVQPVDEPLNRIMSFIPVVYSRAPFTLFPEDYVALEDLVEITKEIMPPMKLRKKSGVYHANIFNARLEQFFKSDPAIFLDGVLMDDLSQVLHLGSDQIRKIEIVNSLWFYGDINFPGILAIFSKASELENIKRTPDVLITSAREHVQSTGHLVPDYQEPTRQIVYTPDLRQLLYWNPELTLRQEQKKGIEFFSSDLEGTYIIRVSGITSKGIQVQADTRISIVSGLETGNISYLQ